MNHQTVMRRLKLCAISVSLIFPLISIGQDNLSEKWKLGLNISPNFAYQQRSTSRNRAILMRPSLGFDFGMSLTRTWKDNFTQFTPSVGFTRNKTKSSL